MRGLRGIAAGALTLIALQVFSTGQGPERGGQLVGWLGSGLQRLMSPKVAGIPRPGLRNVGHAVAGAGSKAAKKGADVISGKGTSGTLPRNPIVTV